ncbi:MAG: hypothetical protein K2P12_03925 [Clostridia bacterium]|nr:hypothetical protein [Clostridia bacterium]
MSGNYYCCVCGKPATICKKETINGVTKVSYYCDDCMKLMEQGHPFDNLISAMFNFNGINYGVKPKMRVCKCGMTERDIINTGKFGCSECYNVFRDIADNYIKTRGYLVHKGKSPNNFVGEKQTQQKQNEEESAKAKVTTPMSEIDKLKLELKLAIKEERFLDADRIAKQIAKLNGEVK